MINCFVIAVNFDGTLCENKWPDIGEPNEEVIKYVAAERCAGAKVILWTCRTGYSLHQAVQWCKSQGLEFDAINENVPEVINHFPTESRKIFAHEYIDDKSCTKFTLPFSTEHTEKKSAKDMAFDRERQKYKKQIKELSTSLLRLHVKMVELENDKIKLRAQMEDVIKYIGLSHEQIIHLVETEKKVSNLANMVNAFAGLPSRYLGGF